MKFTLCAITAAAFALISAADAAPITYHGINPRISPSAYPSNISAVESVAAQTKPKNTRPGALSSSTEFTKSQILINAAINKIADSNNTKLFGSDASGTVDFGGGYTGSFVTVGTKRTLTIFNPDGSVNFSIDFNV